MDNDAPDRMAQWHAGCDGMDGWLHANCTVHGMGFWIMMRRTVALRGWAAATTVSVMGGAQPDGDSIFAVGVPVRRASRMG